MDSFLVILFVALAISGFLTYLAFLLYGDYDRFYRKYKQRKRDVEYVRNYSKKPKNHKNTRPNPFERSKAELTGDINTRGKLPGTQ